VSHGWSVTLGVERVRLSLSLTFRFIRDCLISSIHKKKLKKKNREKKPKFDRNGLLFLFIYLQDPRDDILFILGKKGERREGDDCVMTSRE
jgi:hypothetical protein